VVTNDITEFVPTYSYLLEESEMCISTCTWIQNSETFYVLPFDSSCRDGSLTSEAICDEEEEFKVADMALREDTCYLKVNGLCVVCQTNDFDAIEK